MAADPRYDTPHQSTIERGPYYCHNKPRPVANSLVVGSPSYGSKTFPYRMSIECRYDRSLTDSRCANCSWQGEGEKYSNDIRSKAKLEEELKAINQ